MALISVIIPACNAATTLPETIAALQAQSCTRWEAFVVVAEGCADGTRAVADALAAHDPRLTVVDSPRPGPSAARNLAALELARGDILAFCDADDLWEPGKLLQVAEAILGGAAQAVYGRVGCFCGTPDTIEGWSDVSLGKVTIPMLLGTNPVGPLSNLSVDRKVFAALGGLREDMVQGAELEFAIRLVGEGYHLRGLDAPHVRYRLRPDGLSSDTDAMRAGRVRALRSALRMSFVPTAAEEATYLRQMAQRALRVDAPPHVLRSLVTEGCSMDARAFLLPLRQGACLALAAWLMPALPRPLRRALFRW